MHVQEELKVVGFVIEFCCSKMELNFGTPLNYVIIDKLWHQKAMSLFQDLEQFLKLW
jgi:hypothetical protein